ncbi:unnamed protein product, partial [Amoebophrya sp. A25]|eukprot:GSA25T00003981001.1
MVKISNSSGEAVNKLPQFGSRSSLSSLDERNDDDNHAIRVKPKASSSSSYAIHITAPNAGVPPDSFPASVASQHAYATSTLSPPTRSGTPPPSLFATGLPTAFSPLTQMIAHNLHTQGMP